MILLIAEKDGFLMKSMSDRLIAQGRKAEVTSFDVASLKTFKDPEAVVLFADGDVGIHDDALIYIKDKLMDNNIPFFAVGQPDEIEVVTRLIPDTLISKTFVRPFNASESVEEMIAYISRDRTEDKKKILVVDDSGVVLRDIRAWLGDKYKVFMADSGMKALQFLAKTIPDLILLEYEMPLMDGRQVLELLKNDEDFKKIPVIFLTGKNDTDSVRKVLELKPDGYILKSSGADKIINEVDMFFLRQKAEGV